MASSVKIVAFVSTGIFRSAHDSKNSFLIKNGCAVGFKFITNGAELVKRTADFVFVVNDHFKTAAGRVNNAVTVFAEEEGCVSCVLFAAFCFKSTVTGNKEVALCIVCNGVFVEVNSFCRSINTGYEDSAVENCGVSFVSTGCVSYVEGTSVVTTL